MPLLVTTNVGGPGSRLPWPRPSHATCKPFMVFRELFQILCSWFISHKGLDGTSARGACLVKGDQKACLTDEETEAPGGFETCPAST